LTTALAAALVVACALGISGVLLELLLQRTLSLDAPLIARAERGS